MTGAAEWVRSWETALGIAVWRSFRTRLELIGERTRAKEAGA